MWYRVKIVIFLNKQGIMIDVLLLLKPFSKDYAGIDACFLKLLGEIIVLECQ